MTDGVTRTRPVNALPPTDRRAYLVIESGGTKTREFELREGGTVLGRFEAADLPLDVEGVSRKHARITRAGPAVNLVDLGSKNGTFVNGERIDVAALHHGDRIQLGPVTLRFVLVQPGGAPKMETPSPVLQLTPREREVAMHVARGSTNVEIAQALGITRRTVATHLERIYEHLGIHSRAALATLVGQSPTEPST